MRRTAPALCALLLALAGCRGGDEDARRRIGGAAPLVRGAVPDSVDTAEKLAEHLRGFQGVMRANVVEEPGHKQIEVLIGYRDPQEPGLDGPRVPKLFRMKVEEDAAAVLHKIFTAKVSDAPAAAWVTAIAGWEDRRRGVRIPITLVEISATRDQADKVEWDKLPTTAILYKFQVMNYNRSVLVALKPPILLQ